MPDFTIVPIDAATCRHVRERRTDPIYGYDYDVAASIAGPEGYGPCRCCLRRFAPGERRLLFLHNPFGNELGDFAGPVFIHEEACIPFAGGGELPDEIASLPLFLRSYDRDGHFVEHADVARESLHASIARLLEDSHEVHVRNAVARCYVAKALRIASDDDIG